MILPCLAFQKDKGNAILPGILPNLCWTGGTIFRKSMDSAKDDGDSAGWVGRRKQGGDQKEKAKLGLSSCVCNAVGIDISNRGEQQASSWITT